MRPSNPYAELKFSDGRIYEVLEITVWQQGSRTWCDYEVQEQRWQEFLAFRITFTEGARWRCCCVEDILKHCRKKVSRHLLDYYRCGAPVLQGKEFEIEVWE